MNRTPRLRVRRRNGRPNPAAFPGGDHQVHPVLVHHIGQPPPGEFEQTIVAEGDLPVGSKHHHHQRQVFHQVYHPLFGGIERHFGKLQVRDLAGAAPDAQQHPVFDNAPLAAQHIPDLAIPPERSRFHGAEPVPRTDRMQGGVAYAWVRQRVQVVDRAADQFLHCLDPQQARHRLVALRQIAVPVNAFQLLLLRERRGNGRFEFDAPQGIGVQRDESSMPLFALAKLFAPLLAFQFRRGTVRKGLEDRLRNIRIGNGIAIDGHDQAERMPSGVHQGDSGACLRAQLRQ